MLNDYLSILTIYNSCRFHKESPENNPLPKTKAKESTMSFLSDDTDDINVNHVAEITLGYVFGVIIVGVAKVIIDALSD